MYTRSIIASTVISSSQYPLMEFNLHKNSFPDIKVYRKTWSKIDLDVIPGPLGATSKPIEMGDLNLGTDSKRFYVKASDPQRRLNNLKAIAAKYWLGNFSAMVNDALNKVYDLDPDTGEERGGSIVAEPKPPPWPKKKRSKK